LPYAHGGPALHGRLRAVPEDFVVDERLGFSPSGAGEHLLVRVEKRGANTDWIARQLAAWAGVSPAVVSYAGIKDRHAVCRQSFSIQMPGRPDPDPAALVSTEFRVLSMARHARKLQRGALTGNRFEIRVRGVTGERERATQQLDAIARRGVPNYFGEQRFGRAGDNVEQARAMFAGRRVSRPERSLLLSAARSQVFNSLLAERVAAASWDQGIVGDVFQLDFRGSLFGPEPLDDVIRARLAAGEIHPTGLLPGEGATRVADEALALEQAVCATYADLCEGLRKARVEVARRALRLRPRDFVGRFEGDDLVVGFELPAGAYATSVLREVVDWA
jgi:tRNA pseudouridine13 synthase